MVNNFENHPPAELEGSFAVTENLPAPRASADSGFADVFGFGFGAGVGEGVAAGVTAVCAAGTAPAVLGATLSDAGAPPQASALIFFMVEVYTLPVPRVRPTGARISLEYFSWNLLTAEEVIGP